MISDLIGSMLQGIPSKKNISINKKIKLLRQEDWYKELLINTEIYLYSTMLLGILFTKMILKIY